MGKRLALVAITAGLALASAQPGMAEKIGEIGVDWLGNDIIVEALADPRVDGVVCHVAYFERGVIDRIQKGNWFEDPSNSSIDCRQTRPIDAAQISQLPEQEEIFKSRRSLIWKKLVVKRLVDKQNRSLVYVAHSRQVQDGSAKMSVSSVPYGWNNQQLGQVVD